MNVKENYEPVLFVSGDGCIWWRLEDAIKLGVGYIPVGWNDDDYPLFQSPRDRAHDDAQDLMTKFRAAQAEGSAPVVSVRERDTFVEAPEFLRWLTQSVVQTWQSQERLDELNHNLLLAQLRWRTATRSQSEAVSAGPPYDAVTAVLADVFETPFVELPKRHQARVASVYFPGRWDGLSPDERRGVAVRWDYDHDPRTRADRDRAEQLSIQLVYLSAEISALEKLPPQTFAEKVMKDEQVKDLREQYGMVAEQVRRYRVAREQYGPFRASPVPVDIVPGYDQEARTKHDDLAIELHDIAERMQAADERMTAATVMPLLKARVGVNGSCIQDHAANGVIWVRSSTGMQEKLTMKNLNDRIQRWKKARNAR